MTASNTQIDEATAESLHAEHDRLIEHVEHIRVAALELPSLSPEERRQVLNRIVAFLQGDLSAHAESEEQSLYPRIAGVLGDPRVTAPMLYDHAAIRQLTARLGQASVHDVPLLQELLYGLHALITLHFDKEEELILPLLESHQTGGNSIKSRNGYGDD